MTNKKILIIHDRFQFRGGAERLVLILARALQADIMTEFWTNETYKRSEVPAKLYVLDKGEHPQIVWRYFRAHYNFLFKTRKIARNYDTIIFSGNNCLTAAFNCQRQTKKILYCHSPVRHIFDLKQKARSEQNMLWKRVIYYDIGSWGIRLIYWLGLKQMHRVVANSQNIKNRLQNFIHQKADRVVYPPIDLDKFTQHQKKPLTKSGIISTGGVGGLKPLTDDTFSAGFTWRGQADYYLSFGRVERLKRIPDIVKAFQKMPNKMLIVVSGGPDLDKVKTLARGHSNIKVLGWVSDKELQEYIGNCIATLYIPIDEDFGMSALESNAAGKPVIGVDEGGLKETIEPGRNGLLVPCDYHMDDIVRAVQQLTPEKALSMKDDCIAAAQKYSAARFVREMKEVINETLNPKS